MSSTSLKSIRQVLAVLVKQYPYWLKDREGDPEDAFVIYEQLLRDIPGDVLEAAVLQHIAQSRYFPTVSELRDASRLLTRPSRLSALESWHSKTDPTGLAIKAMLPGWNDKALTMRELGYIQSQFTRTYDQILERTDQEQKILPDLRKIREQYLLEGKGGK